MSKTKTLEDEIEKFIEVYEEEFSKVEKDLPLDGKKLNSCLKNQLDLELTWERLTKRINVISDRCEHMVDTSYSVAVKNEIQNNHRTTSISEAKEFAKNDQNYRDFKKLSIEIKKYRDEARGVLEVVRSRKYILNNMTNAIINGSEDKIL